jgi:4-hydroxy-tetrahydrodipicolinate reductase
VIRVGVIGAAGRMGQMVCRTVAGEPDLALVAAIDRSKVGQSIGSQIGHPKLDVPISDELDRLLEAEVEVAVDFTHPEVVMDDIRWCIEHGIHLVVGTTGLEEDELDEIRKLIEDEGGEPNVIVAPNFALGAVLMQRFAAEAARFFPAAEIIEGVRGGEVEGVRVHSVRLPGLVAHQEVILGGQGQILTIRHDSTDRSSFMPGVLMAIRAVSTRPGLTVGLEPLLDLPEP